MDGGHPVQAELTGLVTEHGRDRKGERKLCSGVCWGDAVNDSSPRGEVGELQVWG